MSRDHYYVRASSFARFFDCPKSWFEQNVLGNRMPSSAPATIGTAVHKSTAVFDEARRIDDPITPDDAAEVLMQHLADPGEEVDWAGTSLRKATTIALGVHARYCSDVAPTRDYIAVEQHLDEMTISFDDLDIDITLTGTLDRMFQKDGKFGVADLKTGARACSQGSGKHRAQVGVYELMADELLRRDGSGTIELPGEIIQLQTSSEYQVAVAPVVGARTLLLGDDQNTGMIAHIARALKTGDFWGNPSSWLCSEKYCPAWTTCFYK
jgi:hypothetical protein